jgi:hypothetical protein
MSKLYFLTSPVSLNRFNVLSNDSRAHPLTALLVRLKRAHATRHQSDELEDSPPLPVFMDSQKYEAIKLQSRWYSQNL